MTNDQSELFIMDPLNHSNNVAKTTFQFYSVRTAFLLAYVTSKSSCECSCHYNDKKLVKYDDKEHCVLERIFKTVKRLVSNIS